MLGLDQVKSHEEHNPCIDIGLSGRDVSCVAVIGDTTLDERRPRQEQSVTRSRLTNRGQQSTGLLWPFRLRAGSGVRAP